MHTVHDVALPRFADPIEAALLRYQEIAQSNGGEVKFDISNATRLEVIEGKPNYARSETLVSYGGEQALKMFIIAFRPGDGTGDLNTVHSMDDILSYSNYPRLPKVVPRSKAAAHTEGHLTVASFIPEQANEDPRMYAGRLDLIGLRVDEKRLIKLAVLGQGLREYENAVLFGDPVEPTVTATAGYLPNGSRFGDPHAVYNATPEVQVGGFIAVPPELAATHGRVLDLLGIRTPELAA